MNNIQLFDFEGHEVRIVGTSENPEWVARDVADVLGIAQSTLSRRLQKIPDHWKGMYLINTLGGQQKMITVKEPGLYALIFRSDKPEAVKFQQWVFSEVLPSIRASGRYELPSEAMRRNRVVTELIKLKQNHQRNLKLVNICNDLIDFTNGTGGFPMLLIEDVEQLLESAQMASYTSTAFYDINIGLKRALGLNRIRQTNTDVTG
jgi:prophage antirepressor-like protein